MPLDPKGLLTQEERQALEQEFDPQGLLQDEEKQRLWGGEPYVLVGPRGERTSVEEYTTQELRKPTHLGGAVIAHIAKGMKDLIVEELPKAMYVEKYAEEHPETMLDLAGLGVTGGISGGAKGAGIGMTKVPKSTGIVGGLKAIGEQVGKLTEPKAAVSSALDTPRQVIKDLMVPEMTPHKWKEYIAELVPLSPETVFKMDKGGAGQTIYKIIDRTEQAKNRFLVEEVSKFLAASGKIKVNSEASARVGRALDGKLPVEQLSVEEQRLYGYLKDRFDFLYNQQAQRVASSPEGYKKVAYAASKKYKPTASVASLSKDLRDLYDLLKAKGAQIRGGRKTADLTKDEVEELTKIRSNMNKVLHHGWLEQLTPGDREAYLMLRRKVKDYLPHIFDRDELAQTFKDEITRLEGKLRLETKPGNVTKIKDRLKGLYESINTMQGGGIVKYQDLPKDFRFRFFEARKGKPGYQFDSMKAYQTYLYGFARKFYGDPALKQVGELFKQVEPSLKPYSRWFIEDWAGLGRKSVANDIAGAIASYQWMTKLGMNPRSALTNFTQRLNTIVEAGEVWSARGYAKGFTEEGKELFRKTGIAQEVPSVMMEGVVPAGMERTRQIAGKLFTMVELGNRKHAFLTGYERAIGQGLSEDAAIQAGIDLVHKTQFRYGKVGMPKQLRGPIGRLAFQFWSYPIKQMEFMVKLARENPLKLAKLLAYAEGGNLLLGEFLNVDMSNAVGLGIDYGEALSALQSLSEGDMRQMFRHMRLVDKGTGLLPTTLGPTFDSALKWMDAVQRGKGAEEALKALMPTQAVKIAKMLEAVKEGTPGKYPIFDDRGKRRYELTGPELVVETFGPKVKRVSKEYGEALGKKRKVQEEEQIRDDIVSKMIKGDMEGAEKLMSKYGISVSDERLKNAFFSRFVDEKTRMMLDPKYMTPYQLMNK